MPEGAAPAAGDYVDLVPRKHRGWPWPEDSFGLTPMFGEDGWCRSCGVPQRPQCGSLVLQRKGFARARGAWVPYWQWNAVCLAEPIARMVQADHDVDLRPVRWHPSTPGAAEQIVAPVVGDGWFDPERLRAATIRMHGTAGSECSACGVWRWMPLPLEGLPPLRIDQIRGGPDVVASPEWFGDGWNAYREVLVRRRLAELLVRVSPRDFAIRELP